jgi:putative glutamine amidotransferase
VVGHKYVNAVIKAVGALPLIAPALGTDCDLDALLEVADGFILPGSVSNVHPSHFGQDIHDPSLPLDPERDAFTLRLIRAAVDAGIPLLGICRGFQEINVAFGGSLHQAVHKVAGKVDHRKPNKTLLDEQYAQVHSVCAMPGGNLAELTGCNEFMVNSLHGQGIDRLGAGLVAEAYSQDGLIEAVSIKGANTFALAVQWHPEWNVMNTPSYLAIFHAFAEACRKRVAQRHTEK